MTNISPIVDSFDQEVDHESRYFENLKELAESEFADPGEEFTVEVELIPATGYFHADRSILIRESINTLGVLPQEDTEKWWQLACAMHDAGETLEATARVWTSHDWEERFYASVQLSLPTPEEAFEEIEDDYVELTDENLNAHKSFTNEMIDHFVPAWRKAHNMTDEQYQAEIDKTRQRLADKGYKFGEPEKISGIPNTPKTPQTMASTPAQPANPNPGAFSPMNTPNQQDMQARQMAITEYESIRKKGIIAWLLWLFLGTLGAHRFYLGHTGYAIAMLLFAWVTFGLWTIIDAFFINRNLRRINTDKWMSTAARYGASAYPVPESAQ